MPSNLRLSDNSSRNLDFVLSNIRVLNVLAPEKSINYAYLRPFIDFIQEQIPNIYPKINFFHWRFSFTITNEYHSNICTAHKLRWHCRLIFQHIYTVGPSHYLLVGFYWIHQKTFQWLIQLSRIPPKIAQFLASNSNFKENVEIIYLPNHLSVE